MCICLRLQVVYITEESKTGVPGAHNWNTTLKYLKTTQGKGYSPEDDSGIYNQKIYVCMMYTSKPYRAYQYVKYVKQFTKHEIAVEFRK